MTKKNAKVITISSVKGGVGKSTFTLWLAGIYASMNKKVIILDMDLYSGAIATSLNLKFNKDIYNLNDDLLHKRFSNTSNYIVKYSDYIDIIASPKDPRLASKLSLKYFGSVLERLRLLYDVILIDTNHLLTDENVILLDKSDKVVYLVSNDLICLKNTRSLVNIYTSIEKNNYLLVLNNALNKDRHYFSSLDMKVMLKDNIDYIIPSSLYVKNIDKWVMDGKIMTLDEKFRKKKKAGIKTLDAIGRQLLKEDL